MINVSNIERFAIHDGPGIRTTVFLKGCPLHCPWCANPETWTKDPVIMYQERLCEHCETCAHVCPNQAVSFAGGNYQIDRSRCTACGICVKNCIPGALSVNGMAMKEEEIIETVLRDKDYYEESGGGLTISGGEPLFQKEAVLRLLKLAKDAGLHVAAETTGMYDTGHLRACEPYIDLFLFDIKHTDPMKLKETTGADFDLVKQNFEYLCEKRPQDVIVRVPVIPGFNDDAVEDIIAFAKAHSVHAVNLLPYHSLGTTKWYQLQKDYRYGDEPGMKPAELKQYEDAVVSIGG